MRKPLILACLSLTTTAAASDGLVRQRPHCRTADLERVTEAGKPGVRRLGELPPARAYRTVYREVDGCPQPVVLREGIGAHPH